MTRVIVFACGLAAATALIAAPEPMVSDAKALVAGLSDPSEKVRDKAAAALKNRPDALPWLRRAARSKDKDTARRAAELLAPYEKKRQEAVAKAIDACIRDGYVDLFMEWHHYWQPENKDDLWSVGPRAAKAGLDFYAKHQTDGESNYLEDHRALVAASGKHHFYEAFDPLKVDRGVWHLRADRLHANAGHTIAFANVAGPIQLELPAGGLFFALGTASATLMTRTFLCCDDNVSGTVSHSGIQRCVDTGVSIVVCRGNYYGARTGGAVLLVDGDIDLTHASSIEQSLIRATGEIRLPKNVKPKDCTIEANVKNATAPYKFFEIRDVGLSATVDAKECAVANLAAIGTAGVQLWLSPSPAEYDLIVTDAKADTPIGNCGLAKGDRIRAIDDARFESPDDFRKKLRRAMVRQGDCLITVVRDGKTIDLPVFFPMPK